MELSKLFRSIQSYASRKNLPLIPVQAENISFISEPNVFYQVLLEKIRHAKHRVILSALYIGTGQKEKALVEMLALKMRQSEDFQVKICLDAVRATRSNHDGSSSVSVLQSLLSYTKTDVKLIDTTNGNVSRRGFLGRFGELLSTYHPKFLVFDDDVILTGANLSDIYFEKRQDRYMCIKSSKSISDYIHRLVDKLQLPNLRESIDDLNKDYVGSACKSSDPDQDCYIIPLFQLKRRDLNQVDEFLSYLNSILPNSSKVYLSTGYFNPSKVIESIKVDSVIGPGEEANGFHNGGGLLKFVPQLYTNFYENYMRRHKFCKIALYNRPGWSFHAKGMWILGEHELYIHLMGSSNFNCRSSYRDLEAQFLVLTTNKSLIEDFERERSKLWAQGRELGARDVTNSGLVYRTAARLLKTFL